jgi:hypothetical protein
MSESVGHHGTPAGASHKASGRRFWLSLFLLASLRAQSPPQPPPASWTEAVQLANSLTRRGEYREAIQSYEALLTEDVTVGNVELRAYLLSEIAYVEIELGDYAAAERRTREALSGLASGERTHTGAFVLAERVGRRASGTGTVCGSQAAHRTCACHQ